MAETAIKVAGLVIVEIGGEKFELEGTIGKDIIVEYHRRFDDALPLPSIVKIIGGVSEALGIAEKDAMENKWEEAKAKLVNIPILKPLLELLSTPIRITDLAINTKTKTYQFGFAWDFTESQSFNIDDFGLKLDAIGLKLTYTGEEPA
jgi:hypothetical protein